MKELTKYSKFVFCFLTILSLGLSANSQSKEELQQLRKEKKEEIEFTKKIINQTNEKQKENLHYLEVLNNQIQTRTELIETITREISSIDKDISQNQKVIQALEGDLRNLKAEYERILRFAYKTRSNYDKLVFIFSSESFNQAYKRLKFLEYYSDYRENQIEAIKETQESLQKHIKDLENKRSEKQKLLKKQKEEKSSLEEDKASKASLVENLKKKAEKLKKELKQKQKRAEELDNAIEEAIKREVEARKEKEDKAEEKSFAATPEGKVMSGKFEKNKHHLPWPVESGFISGEFGKQPHPTLSGVYVSNKGIDITTNKNAIVRAVFEGEVRRIVDIRAGGLVVLVRHGAYYSVYSNLAEAFVEPGNKIEAREKIGRVAYSAESGKSELHFQIWKKYDKLNPSSWLTKK